jgi:hypothetical protein
LFDAVKSIATAKESYKPLRRISTNEGRLMYVNYVKLILPAFPEPSFSFTSNSVVSLSKFTFKSVTPTIFPEFSFAIAILMGASASALQT